MTGLEMDISTGAKSSERIDYGNDRGVDWKTSGTSVHEGLNWTF